MASEGASKSTWLRPRFTIAALLVLITLCAPFLAYLSFLRRQNDLRQAAFEDVIAKGMRLEPAHDAPTTNSAQGADEAGARKFWTSVVGESNLPSFMRVQIHDFFGKNRPRPPLTNDDLQSLEHLPEIEEFTFYYSKDVTDEGLFVLGKLPKLRRIMLNDLSLLTGEFLDRFPEDNVVESLWLIDLKAMDGSKLQGLRRFKKLRELRFTNIPLLENKALHAVELAESIKDLYLNGVKLSDETLAKWLSQVHLDRLELCAPISPAAKETLATQTALRELVISNAAFVDEDFSFLQNFDQLTSLHLNGMPIRGEVLDYVAKPEQVTSIGFSSTLLADDNLPKLARFSDLRHVDLAYTPLSGEGFGADVAWPEFKQVWLSGARFSEAGKESFAKLKGLRDVNLPGNWTVDDLTQFPMQSAKCACRINAYHLLRQPSKNGEQIFSYIPTINPRKFDHAPADLMQPVAELYAKALEEDKEVRKSWESQ